MKFTAKELARVLNGTIEGNEIVEVSSLSKIEEGSPGSVSFLFNPKYTSYIYTTTASVVLVNQDLDLTAPVTATLIRVPNAQIAFARLLELYNTIRLNKTGISARAFIAMSAKLGSGIYAGEFAIVSDNAVIGNNVKIYPQVYIGDHVVIGDNTTLFAGVKVYSDCVIGSNCIIHSGTVIGSDGFRFAPESEDNKKIVQIGNVIVEDEVEIGANCTIDRATFGSTIICKGVKFDNLIHIAHNVIVGQNTYIAAQSGIAGSSKIGHDCMISGQVGITGHIHIADNTTIAGKSFITRTINGNGKTLMGAPAFDAVQYRKAFVYFRNFQSIVERITALEKELGLRA